MDVIFLDLLQMEYFRTTAQCESVTKAAALLHISQPSLSVSISKLEKDLGAPLFDRVGGRIRLNNTGRTFLKYVNKIFLDVAEARTEISDQTGPGQNHISIAVCPMGISNELITGYAAENPQVSFTQFVHSIDNLIPSLESAEVDFAISNEKIQTPEIEWMPLMSEPVMVLVAENHPLSQSKYVEMHQLLDERFVIQRSSFHPKGEYAELFEPFLCEPKASFVTNELNNAYSMTEMGAGIMLVSYFAAKQLTYRGMWKLTPIPLKANFSKRIIGVAKLKGHYLTKTVQNFYDYTINYYAHQDKLLLDHQPWD